ncbi:hypothetical protein GOP47_0000034 [Adiantum capillus-veneris]|uniref:Large ribosomal subunit protein mL45 n=1 Tax=Adiantum capillus-veneris TaxID=13818 RepID=A0A9D4VCA1_ADICA|nr:hypothetical protein GOP47_0000034 [Adiantum capillus-veneris]
MAFMRWARTSANQVRGGLASQNAGYKSLVPSFDLHKQVLMKDDGHVLANQRSILLGKKTPYLFHRHGFARTIAPPHLQRQVGLKVYRGSSGTVIDPYHVRTRSPFLERWFTRKGWQEIKQSIMHQLRSGYALAKLRQMTGQTRKAFVADVERLYTEINTAIAEGNRNALKELVTESMLSVLKNEIKKREGIWDRVEWRLGGPLNMSTLQARMAAIDPKDLDKAFVQITVRIKSTQYFGAFDQDGKLVAGDPLKQISVEDIWVFETFLGSPQKKFRLCGRITL